MNAVDAAVGRFETFGLKATARLSPSEIDALANWFCVDFSAAASSLFERPDVRVHARWTINNLGKCSTAPARRLLEDVERALVEQGSNLAAIAANPNVYELYTQRKQQREYENLLQQLGMVAGKKWRDLAAASDYFWPSAGLNLSDTSLSDRDQIPKEFDPCRWAELQAPGDLVARCALRRVKHWGEFLERAFVDLRYRMGSGSQHDAIFSGASRNWIGPYQDLRHLCCETREAQLRESLIAIVQLHCAFCPKTDVGWLRDSRIDPAMACNFRRRLEHGDAGIAWQAVRALVAASELYRQEPDPELIIQEAAASHLLCIVETMGRRQAWWGGELINADWKRYRRAWTMLLALAQCPGGVDESNDLDVSLKDAWADLKKMLPREILSYLSVDHGRYRLTIPRQQVFVGRCEHVERLKDNSRHLVNA